ncbi:hypothetical protein GCM10022419_132860 [Nonomuraea rosea]|uniref:Uncharacterized protein n=1 Tax=Nonomuraea rosea TaxID=638574 RepID=A0ABP7A4D7_9ACTN
MGTDPAGEMLIVVLCPRLAPVAHGPTCSFRHLFLSPAPDRAGDWSGTVTSLDEVRQRFPGVLFHACLRDALHYGIRVANSITLGLEPPPAEDERRPRGEHPYGRS